MASALLAMPACSSGVDEGSLEASDEVVVEESAGPAPDAEAEEQRNFNPDSLPISEARLGEFPYFHLPDGYHTKPRNESVQALGRFAFWHGKGYIEANGRIYQGNIQAVDGKVFSSAELTLALEEQITGKGGVLIADSVVPSGDRAPVLTRDFVDEYNKGLCWPTEPVRTYVIRSVGHHVWVHACTYGDIGGGWVIADIEVPNAVASPLPAPELTRQLRESGEADLRLQYLPSEVVPRDADAQIAALVALLEDRPAARLSIRGSAGTGLSANDREALARARARHLYEALVTAGAAADQLDVQGGADVGVPGVSVAYVSGS